MRRAGVGDGRGVARTVGGRRGRRGADAVVDYAVHVKIEVVDAGGGMGVEFAVDEWVAFGNEAVEFRDTHVVIVRWIDDVGW